MVSDERVSWIDLETLLPVVREAVGDPSFQIEGWNATPIHGGAGGGPGICRVTGEGRGKDSGRDGSRMWSVILKVLGLSEQAFPEMDSWGYWRREAHAYETGFFNRLPQGICTPRLLGVQDLPDSRTCLWLEDLALGPLEGPPWPLHNYGRAAYHFGVMNGLYLTTLPLPADRYWSRGFLRGFVDLAAPAIDPLRGLMDHPTARTIYPHPVNEMIFRLWDARETIYSVLNRLPQTFCHMDAFSRNLFLRRLPKGADQIVTLDWAFSGIGAVGEEIVPLVAATLMFTGVNGSSAAELYGTVLDGYLTGLREVGWHGNPRLVEFVFQTAAPLRFLVAITRYILASILQPETNAMWEIVFGRPWEEQMEITRETNILWATMGKMALDQLPDYL